MQARIQVAIMSLRSATHLLTFGSLVHRASICSIGKASLCDSETYALTVAAEGASGVAGITIGGDLFMVELLDVCCVVVFGSFVICERAP